LSVVVTPRDRGALEIAAEIPAERGYHGAVVERGALTGEMQASRRDHAGAVDHHADDFALGLGEAAIDGVGGRGRRRVDADQAEIAWKARKDC
jgi:hypothetical protein